MLEAIIKGTWRELECYHFTYLIGTAMHMLSGRKGNSSTEGKDTAESIDKEHKNGMEHDFVAERSRDKIEQGQQDECRYE